MKQDQNLQQGEAERPKRHVLEKDRFQRENWIILFFAGLVMAFIGFEAGFDGLNRVGWLCFAGACFWNGVKE